MAAPSIPAVRPTPSELEILHAIYASGSASSTDLCALPQFRDKAYTTVQTLCTRLREKGYLRASRLGRDTLFSPALPLEAVLRPVIEDFFKGVLGDSPEAYQLLFKMIGERLDRVGSPQAAKA